MKRLVLSLAVVGAILALAAGIALAQATTDTFHETEPVDQVFDQPCVAEPQEQIRLTGEVHILTHVTEDANGGLHVLQHSQFNRLSGTGLESGTRYRGVGVIRDETYIAPGGPREFTGVARFHLVSAGPSDNLLVFVTAHTTFNANGEPSVNFQRIVVKCAG
jgi:hypothetical protein